MQRVYHAQIAAGAAEAAGPAHLLSQDMVSYYFVPVLLQRTVSYYFAPLLSLAVAAGAAGAAEAAGPAHLLSQDMVTLGLASRR